MADTKTAVPTFDVKDAGDAPPRTKQNRSKVPNPLEGAVSDAVKRGIWKTVAVPDEATDREARKLVRRAARELDVQISMRTGDGALHFGPKPTR